MIQTNKNKQYYKKKVLQAYNSLSNHLYEKYKKYDKSDGQNEKLINLKDFN